MKVHSRHMSRDLCPTAYAATIGVPLEWVYFDRLHLEGVHLEGVPQKCFAEVLTRGCLAIFVFVSLWRGIGSFAIDSL